MNQYMTHQSRSKDEAYHLAQVIPDHIPSSEYSRIKTRMLCHLFEQQVFPHLQNGKTYGVKLDIRQEPFRSYSIRSEGTQIDMRVTMYPADQRIIEFVDYRPMNWMTLSQTAMEEIRHRLSSWWRRPIKTRLYLWRLWLDGVERRHFGYTFDRRGHK
jgi:hypothetical protein